LPVLPVEGTPARQHLVQHEAEGEDVAARIGWLALGLLGRHVLHRPQDYVFVGQRLAHRQYIRRRGNRLLAAGSGRQACPELCQSEVEEFDALWGHEDVGRLEIAMCDALAVGRGQG